MITIVWLALVMVMCHVVAEADSVSETNFRYPRVKERLKGYVDDVDGDDVTVDTIYGRLRGKRGIGEPLAGGETSTVDWFLGVPYAAPPIGRLRFKATVPPETWKGTRDALRMGNSCPQESRNGILVANLTQDEDCLYLNIYSPVPTKSTMGPRNSSLENERKLYPVMVYIHGGSYRVGSGNTFLGAHILAQYGTVVITINYRLAALGFLSSRSAHLGGNYGLYDQIAALRWIKDCIEPFRGDPDRVTLFGSSAGGASVGILSVSPKAKGLFQYAIVQSGSPLSFWAVHNETADLEKFVRDLSQKVHCNEKEIADTVNCLRSVSWRDLVEASRTMPRTTPSGTDLRPVPDGSIVPDLPRKRFDGGHFSGQALMTGIVDSEMTKHIGILFLPDLYQADYPIDLNFDDGMERESFIRIIRHVVCVKFGFDETIADLVTYKYTNWSHDVMDPYENRRQYVNFLTDLSMWSPTVQLASYVAKTPIPTYLYTMQLHPQQLNASEDWMVNHHQAELPYIFGSPFTGVDVDEFQLKDSYTDEDRKISRMMMTIWSNFAKTGNPSHGHVMGESFANWTKYNSKTANFIRLISTSATMENHHRAEFVTFWNDLVVKLQIKLDRVRNPGFNLSTSISNVALATFILGILQVSSLVAILILILVLCRKRSRR